MTEANSTEDYRLNVEKFLQTAVFVDDEIYNHIQSDSSEVDPRDITEPTGLKSPIRGEKSTSGSKFEESPKDENGNENGKIFSPKELVSGFAEKQIACALCERRDINKDDSFFKLCSSSDIVIIDWIFNRDGGKQASKLIVDLVKSAIKDTPNQAQLIIIYTKNTDLSSIAKELYGKIKDDIDNSQIKWVEKKFAFQVSNSKVSVYGKDESRSPQRVIPSSQLADIAVKEFMGLVPGLLHSWVLLRLAEIRKNSRKILAKFNELDEGFITHRALLPPEDAFSHFASILTSEIESVLDDASLGTWQEMDSSIKNWCQQTWQPNSGIFQNDREGTLRESVKKIFDELSDEARKDMMPNILGEYSRKKNISPKKLFLKDVNADTNEAFAHLMHNQTFYDKRSKVLKLGTIIKTRTTDQYLLCMQPVCDSTRIEDAERTFVFVSLHTENPNKGETTIVFVKEENGGYKKLYFSPKSYYSYTAKFSPLNNPTQTDSPQIKANEKLDFEDTCGEKYLWIDQLKPAHAQRSVEKFAREFSRVGLAESEVFRKINSKKIKKVKTANN